MHQSGPLILKTRSALEELVDRRPGTGRPADAQDGQDALGVAQGTGSEPMGDAADGGADDVIEACKVLATVLPHTAALEEALIGAGWREPRSVR